MRVNFLISTKDPVGITIKKLGYRFDEIEDDVIDFRYDKGDVIVIFSRHESSSKTPSLTVHYPGNPGSNAFGGEPFKLGIAFPKLLSSIFREILTLPVDIHKAIEATHHGPTYQTHPVIFVEIGSDINYWQNENLVKMMVEATLRGVDKFDQTVCEEIIAGVGGTHYTPYFSKISTSKCIGHVVSKYYLNEINQEVVRQVIMNSVEKVDKIIFDNVNSSIKNKIVEYIKWINSNIKLESR